MSGTRWERWAPASGIVYAVLYVVGIILILAEAVDESSDAEILSYYADSGNRAGEITGFFVALIGVLFFLLFVSTLRNRLSSVEPEPNGLSTLAFGAGVASATLLIGAIALFVGSSTTAEFVSRYVVDPNLVRFAFGSGYLFLFSAVMVMCVLVTATSVLTLRTSVLPRWLGWVGLAAVVLAVVEAFVLAPIFVFPVWSLIVSVVLIGRTPTSRA